MMKQLQSGRNWTVGSNTILRISIQDGNKASIVGYVTGIRVNDRSKLAGELDAMHA